MSEVEIVFLQKNHMPKDLKLPSNINFPLAVSFTQELFEEVDNLPSSTLQTLISQLVSTTDGARGFFVTFLTQDYSLAPPIEDAIVQALRTAPDIVSSLLVKNLVMSTAMVVTHRRQHKPEMAKQSQQTSSRSATLIEQLQLIEVNQEAQHLFQSLTIGSGAYSNFLEKWNYDSEQKQDMKNVLLKVFPELRK